MIGQMGASAILNGVAKGALSASSGGTLPLLYAMTEAGVNYAIASYMRDSETSSEAFSAYQERVLNGANELGINISNIKRSLDWLHQAILQMIWMIMKYFKHPQHNS